MKVRTLSYQAVKEKFKSDHQEPSNSQNKNVAKVMARKSDSDITLATAPIALKTFLWQELKVLQQVLKEFFQNSFGKVVLRPLLLLGHPAITLATFGVYKMNRNLTQVIVYLTKPPAMLFLGIKHIFYCQLSGH